MSLKKGENPYLEAARKNSWFVSVEADRMAPLGEMLEMDAYRELRRKYAWAIPNDAAIQAIAEWSPIVEVGSGTGYWAALLAATGADVVAFDQEPYQNEWCDGSYYPVAVGGSEKAAGYPERTLLLCWPPYKDSLAVDALRAYRGKRLVYIGEGSDGCCGSEEFFQELDCHWRLVRRISIPHWWGIHDAVYLYERAAGFE